MKIKTLLLRCYCHIQPFSGVLPLQKIRPGARLASGLSVVAMLALAAAGNVQAALVGHWTFDDQNNPWQETSGYTTPGTHDGLPINAPGATTAATWSAEGHAGGRTGGSLDLTAGNCALRVNNTSQFLDAGYQSTFDDTLANGMTIAFWAKGWPDTWAPWVSKNGEGVGYQVRRAGSETFATFTLRHHRRRRPVGRHREQQWQ